MSLISTLTSRPANLTRLVRQLIRDVARRLPEFAHLRPSRILVIAGEARRSSKATVRPLAPVSTGQRPSSAGGRRRPVVSFRGKRILYIITLRPPFFRTSSPQQRVETILHELFHISTRFDGTLHPGHRHGRLGVRFQRRLRPLVRRYLAVMPPEYLEALSTNGLVLARQWLERPASSYPAVPSGGGRRHGGRRLYDERQLFLGPVMMVTRRSTSDRRRLEVT